MLEAELTSSFFPRCRCTGGLPADPGCPDRAGGLPPRLPEPRTGGLRRINARRWCHGEPPSSAVAAEQVGRRRRSARAALVGSHSSVSLLPMPADPGSAGVLKPCPRCLPRRQRQRSGSSPGRRGAYARGPSRCCAVPAHAHHTNRRSCRPRHCCRSCLCTGGDWGHGYWQREAY